MFVVIDIFFVVVIFPITLLIVIGRRIWNIRVGYFYSDRIGHFVFDAEWYLLKRNHKNLSSQRSLDLF